MLMSEAISVVGAENDVFFCRSERCPRLDLHRRHDVNRCIDRYVLEAVPSGQVVQFVDLTPRSTNGVSPIEIPKSLRRLVVSSKLKAVYPDDDAGKSAVAYYQNNGVLDAVTWSPTALARCPVDRTAKLNALDESILKIVGRYVLKVFWQIYRDVQHDYGSVADRTVYRRLARLVDMDAVSRISPPLVNDGGYVLPGSPLLRDMPTAYEQIRCAHLERRSL